MVFKIMIVLAGLSLFLVGCDTEKFFGYQYEADRVSRFIEINGRIANVFDGQPVEGAEIFFQSQRTESSGNGAYQIDFIKTSDQEFGDSIEVVFHADKYYSLDTTMQIFLADNHFDVELVYGAPIVLLSERLFWSDTSKFLIRATLFDYQGISTLSEVLAYGQYYDQENKRDFQVAYEMTLESLVDANTAVYSGLIDKTVPSVGEGLRPWFGRIVDGRHYIGVKDQDGFEEYNVFLY